MERVRFCVLEPKLQCLLVSCACGDSIPLKVGCHGPHMRTEIYCSANLTLNLRVDSEYVVA